MVGLVIATHGRLAEELLATASQIVGPLPRVSVCLVEPGLSMEEIRGRMRSAVLEVDDGDGVIVLADLVGGTPCNQSLSLCGQLKLEVVTGVNLPMLVKAGSLRAEGLPLSQMAQSLAQYGQKHITCASAALREAQAAQHAPT